MGISRSENMRRIRSEDTSPEIAVRRLVYGLGFRYRLHRKDIPESQIWFSCPAVKPYSFTAASGISIQGAKKHICQKQIPNIGLQN